MIGAEVETADRAERESFRRFEALLEWRRIVSDAARQADALARLEYALRYEFEQRCGDGICDRDAPRLEFGWRGLDVFARFRCRRLTLVSQLG